MPQETATAPASSPAPQWDAQSLRDPHGIADKRSRVQHMFAAIAPSYDLNNRLHSLWMDQSWRRKAVKMATLRPGDDVVDVACGTGDLSLKFRAALDRLAHRAPSAGSLTGIDFTFEMLPIARRKAEARGMNGTGSAALRGRALFVNGDAQSLPLPDACCDVVSIAFGIRNVASPARAIREFYRVLRPGGRLIILEFSLPSNPLLRRLYNLYFRHILPTTATWISRDKTGAYKYLPQSVNTFIGPEQMTDMMRDEGFTDLTRKSMTFGVCFRYRGVKA
jgi:demethylmenaquinone methyltransferase/2-methoxy-6-polyprenyl-1,4-benzoquinol methylase